tara:strand:- start:256 stop:1011 length:756 start_codon:yes stop_codon:yes gene_type:complete
MDIALVIGKKNSTGVPGKNVRPILGRPTAEYAFIAAKAAGMHKIFVSTDSQEIKEIGEKYESIHIERPAELATPSALTEDVLIHAYNKIKEDKVIRSEIDTISLLFCNNPAIDVELLKEAISFLKEKEDFDSCFSVAKYDMFSPARARKISEDGAIEPFVDLKHIDSVSSIRDSQGSVYFCDLSIQVMKPICFEEMDSGQLPFKWQGKKSKALLTDYGFDIDTEWQFVVIEHWLKEKGYTESETPWGNQDA